jgi:hypothetical protein
LAKTDEHVVIFPFCHSQKIKITKFENLKKVVMAKHCCYAFKPLDLTPLSFKNSPRAITVHCENGLVVDIFKALFFSWFVLIFSNAITEK